MFLSARLAISVVIGGALLIPAASCGGDSGRDVTPLAEVEATTSTTTVSGDRGTAASTTSEPSKASAAEPPEAGDSSDSTGTTVTPTSAPSAERFADGGQRLREQEPGARRCQFADLRVVERRGFVRAGCELGAIAIVLRA